MNDKTIRVLLVEDNPGDARLIRDRLTDAAQTTPDISTFDVTRTTKLSTGLKRLAKGDIDVILLDLSLPDAQGLDGFTAVHAKAPQVPIVVLSNPEDTALAIEAVQEGAQDHLVKGQTSGDLLVRSMRYAIERKQAEGLLRLQRDLCTALGGTGDLAAAMDRLLESAVQIEGVDCGGVYLVDKSTGGLDLIAHRGLSSAFIERASHYAADAPQARLVMAGDPVHQPYPEILRRGKDKVRREEGLRALVVIPVVHEGQVIAALNLASHAQDEIPVTAREAVETMAARIGGVVARISAEKALRESEVQYRTLFDRVPVGLYRSTPAGEIIDANPALVRILGYPDRKALLATDAADLYVDAEERTRFKELIEREGTLRDFETQMRQYDGTVISVRIISQAIRDDGGQILYYEGSVGDVTERVRSEAIRAQTEETLRQTEVRFRSLVEHTTDAVFCYEYDPPIPTDLPIDKQVKAFYEGTLAECNDVAAKSYGATRADQVVGKRLTELFGTAPSSLDGFFAAFIRSDYRIVDAEGVEILKDGSKRYFLNSGYGVIEDGMLLRVWGTFRDITKRKQAEEALRESEERLRMALEAANEELFDWNMETGEAYYSPRYYTMFGYEADELPASHEAWLDLIHPDDRPYAVDTVNEYTEGKRDSHEIEYRIRTKSGEWRWVLSRGKAIERDAGGIPVRMVGTHVDITERVRAEKALRIERDLGIALGSTGDLMQALNQVLDTTLQMEEIDSGGVYLFDALTGELNLVVHTGLTDEFIASVSLYDADAPNTQLVLAGEPVYAHSLSFPPGMRDPLRREGLRALAVIPVMYEGHVIAALSLASHVHDEIPVSTRHALEAVAAQMGGVIARLEAVRALQASEERYRIISEITSDVTYAVGVEPDGTTVPEWVAGAHTRVTGYTLGELEARGGLSSLVHPDDMDLDLQHLQVHFTGQPDVAEYRIVTKGGDERWLRDYGYPVWGETEGRVVRIIGAAQDITEQRLAKEALEKAELEKGIILDSQLEHVVYHDTQHRILWVNKAGYESVGATREELIGRYCHKVWAERSQPCEDCPVRKAMQTNQPQEVTKETPDGRHWYIRGYPVQDAEGSIVGGIEVTQDITERVHIEQMRAQTEEALRESEANLKEAQRIAHLGSWELDLQNNAFTVSDEMLRIYKYEDRYTGSVSMEEFASYVHPDDRETVLSALNDAVAEGLPYELEFRIVRTDGQVRVLHAQGEVVRDESGQPIRVVGTGLDVTERARAEEALRKEQDLLSRVMEMSPVGIVVAGRDGQITFANARAEQVLGLARDEIIERTYNDPQWRITDYEGNPFPDEQLPFARVMATGQPVHDVRHAIEWPDGQRVLLSINAAPLFEAGQAHGMVATVDDVTERVRSEQERAKAEEALRESEMRYRTLFERANDAIFLMHHEQIIDCNRAAEVMFGRPRGDIVGGAPYQFSPPDQPGGRDSREKALEKVDAVLAGIPQSFEWVHCRPDDSLFSTEVSLTRMDLEGELLLLAIMRDITERKQIEEALRKREAHQALVLGSLPMAFYTAYPFGDYGGTWVSDQIDHLVGFTAEEFVVDTHLWASRLHPEDRERVLDAFERLPQTGALETEYRWQAADGEYVWLLDHAVFARDKDGEPREIIGTWLDITDRKRTEEEREQLLTQIQEQAQQLQQVIDSVPEGVILLDDKARIVLANPLGKTHLGILADTLVGGTLTRLGSRPLPEILASPPQGLWHDIAAEGRYFQIIARSIETGPVPGGWALVIRDVTQQLEFERRAQQQERLVAVGQLAAGIAHDFNNIMAVITLYANMSLCLPDLPPELYKRLQTIDEQARRASELIQQIMDFSRRAVLERGPMDLLVFVKEQTRLLQRTLPESIIVSLSYGRDEYTIRADPTRIQQVIVNLATNARDAMPEGGQLHISLDLIRVERDETGPVPEMQAGDWVCIEVADTGVGIPEDVLPHIYDPFFTTKEPGKGTGLGLAQVYGIVKQHEGHIDVRTIEGEGTTFIIYLPALTVEGAAIPPAEIKDLPKGEGQTILLVEDDARTRAAMVSSLELLGYEVLETANGREALEVLEHHASQVALVLSDMVMPEMGGRVLFQELTRLHPGTKVMLMSGHPMEEGVLEQLRAEGLTRWLPKPPDLNRLAEAIAQALADDA